MSEEIATDSQIRKVGEAESPKKAGCNSCYTYT